ncbi:MAG TPA: 30S ribosomal protein S5 [Candidatus Eisenbacteria bacterium]|jgi:small subunit ribosomal protein S5|nr:30S ribosomal protein S5 [Candidatus Eisenbacteria bacterium]
MARPEGGRGRGKFEDKEFDQRILELARVTRVTKGGKRMRFRACVIIGDRKGRVGFGLAKGLDVQASVQKAATQAKKKLITVPIVQETIPHAVHMKFAAASLILMPAPKGTGIKAGGAVRVVLELAGVPNASAKILGSNNKINNTKATFNALKALRARPKKAAEAKKPEAEAVAA